MPPSRATLSTSVAILSGLLSIFILAQASSQGEILLAIKKKWKANLTSWKDVNELCETWEGVQCNQQKEAVALNLTNVGLQGPVPDEISSISSLISLDLSLSKNNSGLMNRITGDLSPLGSLTELQSLNLSHTYAETQFPTAVLKLTKLVALRIESNNLQGAFPAGLSKLTNLQYLYIGNCSLTGDLPSELGSMVNLIELSLWKNQFGSVIPIELSNLSNLKYLNLHDCKLWGGLPSDFQKLKNIEKLDLRRNDLTGIIPDSWDSMEKLQILILKNNFLTKSLPLWIPSHASLQTLDVANNKLYGPFPNLIKSKITNLSLKCNYFNGSKPIRPSTADFSYIPNCFGNISNEGDTSRNECPLSCSDFYHQLQGDCPLCPLGQNRTSPSLCTCGKHPNYVENSGSHRKNIGILAGSIGAAVFLFVIMFVIFYKRKYKNRFITKRGLFSLKEPTGSLEFPTEVRRFTFQELEKATSNFHIHNEIGRGGFGKVFLGVLDNGGKVAIKCASATSMQGISEFQNEVLLLSRLHHRNLVHLEGFCNDSDVQILVYEYVTNGNLSKWLFEDKAKYKLDCYKRLDIAVGIAQGLDYLHSFADPPVIHRDVKLTNILLDDNLVAKLSDFGLSKATQEFQSHVSTAPAGTVGYMDPQYYLRKQLTTASDVYSFGVVLLELVTGQQAIDTDRQEDFNLVEWVKPKLTLGGVKAIVDPQLGSDFPEHVYHDVVQLAIQCAAFNKEDRPTMKEVVSVLEAHLKTVQPCSNEEMPHSNESQSKEVTVDNGSTSAERPQTSSKEWAASDSEIEIHSLLAR